ncbi:MAG: hypothetical protein WAN71_06680 [Mycobacterium sp.]|uniref:hypothetical protein n=1 Tax=Mycobacterium sp. TaxID=1785 RepID=UPI003BAE94D3
MVRWSDLDLSDTIALRRRFFADRPRLHDAGGFGARHNCRCSWPARYRYGLPLLARLLPAVVNSYKLNVFTLGTPS